MNVIPAIHMIPLSYVDLFQNCVPMISHVTLAVVVVVEVAVEPFAMVF